MPYATAQDIVDRLPNGQEGLLLLADRDGDGVADEAVVSGALGDAADEIDSYLAAVYTLPLPSVPPVLVRLSVDIAIYRMAADAARATEEHRVRYEDAVKLLQSISRRTAALPLPDGVEPPAAHIATFSAGPRLFKRGGLP
ncbi:MAG: gp436 family protein [Acidobacteriota bacterium]